MSKFGNVKVTGLGGMSFKSKREREHALWLASELQAGRIKAWQYEKSYDLFASNGMKLHPEFPPSVLIGKHKPDFTVTLLDDREEVHEIKGGPATKTEAWYLRMKIFKANRPEVAYKVFDGLPRVRGGRVIQYD